MNVREGEESGGVLDRTSNCLVLIPHSPIGVFFHFFSVTFMHAKWELIRIMSSPHESTELNSLETHKLDRLWAYEYARRCWATNELQWLLYNACMSSNPDLWSHAFKTYANHHFDCMLWMHANSCAWYTVRSMQRTCVRLVVCHKRNRTIVTIDWRACVGSEVRSSSVKL